MMGESERTAKQGKRGLKGEEGKGERKRRKNVTYQLISSPAPVRASRYRAVPALGTRILVYPFHRTLHRLIDLAPRHGSEVAHS
jgi:hypothetical protein